MNKRVLGRMRVNPIGLGCMGMSEHYGEADEQESLRTLHRAFELGVRHFDTAIVYGKGHNEELLCKFMRELGPASKEMFVASKFGILRVAEDNDTRVLDGTPDNARRSVDGSLKRLELDSIPLYYQHRVDPSVPIEETVGALGDLVAEGKIQAIGLSEVSAATLERAHRTHPIAAVQSEYSLWSRDVEAGVLPVCEKLGVAFVAYSPLGRGFLTGSIRAASQLSADDFRLKTPRFEGENFDGNLKLADSLVAFAESIGCTPAQLCLAWILAQGEHIHVIPGTKKRKYLEDNCGASAVALTQEQLAQLDKLAPPGVAVGDRYSAGGMRTVNA